MQDFQVGYVYNVADEFIMRVVSVENKKVHCLVLEEKGEDVPYEYAFDIGSWYSDRSVLLSGVIDD